MYETSIGHPVVFAVGLNTNANANANANVHTARAIHHYTVAAIDNRGGTAIDCKGGGCSMGDSGPSDGSKTLGGTVQEMEA